MKEIWVYEPHNFSEKLIALASARVSAQRRAYAARLTRPEDKLPLLLGEAFVRAAAQRSGLCEAFPQWNKKPGGKPFLSAFPNFHFNISHTAGAVLAVFHTAPVGADTEYIGHGDPALAQRFFAPGEVQFIQNGPAEEIARRFCRIWTQKEAYVKFSGQGIAAGMTNFDVTGDCGVRFFCFENSVHCFCVCARESFAESNILRFNAEAVLTLLTALPEIRP